MKLHWGHKIGIVYTLFAGFMIFMLLKSRTTNHELVTDQYYQNELVVQDKIDASGNLAQADFKVEITRGASADIHIQFSGDLAESPEGKVNLYKPDNAEFDQEMTLQLSGANAMTLAPTGGMGRYKVQLTFTVDGTPYYTEREVLL